MDMTSLALSLLVVLALATTSLGAGFHVDLDSNGCGNTARDIPLGSSVNITTEGSIVLGDGDCVAKFKAIDANGECSQEGKELVMCVNVRSIKSMCYVSAEFSSTSKIVKLDCSIATPPKNEWCFNGNEELVLRLYQQPDKTYKEYGLNAKVTTSCAFYDTGRPNQGSISEPGSEPSEDTVTFLDVQDAINSARVIGIVVGVCLACMFLVALLITYFYYKNKAYTGIPRA